ncbi:ATPase subunit of ABC transporter with duplicated ATPase domains [Paenibacillus endophyticus]|uniref:ATPase subunit of ABC transporter with duplicated ATPase domains n=1 Tax=Paenibacillus endophyticus TaxID=1294268 RepID=A0A7W5CDI5_9BACL|nr:ABC-F type ribosomal protection protein [Paenibacillus endophyticus]MBB3154849.1 ATPase subunit of ABC transporter with duplicated ATPase domains [Paenibacillus endophyticus]
MIIVNMQNVKKYYSANLLFDGLSLQVHEGERIGLIGANGSGKSTLLQMISGGEHTDEGMLAVKKDLIIGYLPQVPADFDKLSVYEVLTYGCRELISSKKQMSEMEKLMSDPEVISSPEAMERLLSDYAQTQEQFERDGGYVLDAAVDQVATGLQIERSLYARAFSSLSGGEKTRISLASQLIVRPSLLLLDEPTNHLDLRGIEWLEQFLKQYEGTCMIVSHDRYFLDAACSRMIELEDGEAHTFHTGYTGYVKEKEELLLQQFAHYQEQQKQIKKMKETIKQLEEWGRIGSNEKFFKRAASIRKALEKLERVKRPILERKTADFELSQHDRSGRRVISFEKVIKQFGERKLLDNAAGSLMYGEKVVLIGDNGSGKTTLFKLLLGQQKPDSGELVQGASLTIGYLAQEEKEENRKLTVLEYFKAEGRLEEGEARHMLASYLFYGTDVFKPLHALSGGEWSRLRLALLILKKPNLLLLDEPTNHLDIRSREALEEALEQYQGTILAISHDRYFINRIAERVWELSAGQLHAHLGNYDDCKEKLHKNQAIPIEQASDRKTAAAMPSRNESKPIAIKETETRLKRENLELTIAELERKMAAAGQELELLAAANDPARLNELWELREQDQARLELLLDKWMRIAEKE